MANFFGSDQIKSVQNGSSLDFYLSKHVNIEKCHDYHENKHVQAQGSQLPGHYSSLSSLSSLSNLSSLSSLSNAII